MTQEHALAMVQQGGHQPALIIFPHPLQACGQSKCHAAFKPGETMAKYIARNNMALPRWQFVVWHNGFRVPDALWRRLIPRQGDQVIIRTVVRGGGGSNKVLRSVAMIALVVATYGAGSWEGLAALAGDYAAVAGAALMLGGTLFIAPLIPEVKP